MSTSLVSLVVQTEATDDPVVSPVDNPIDGCEWKHALEEESLSDPSSRTKRHRVPRVKSRSPREGSRRDQWRAEHPQDAPSLKKFDTSANEFLRRYDEYMRC